MDARTLSPYRIAHVVGARPQFVKLKPLAEAIVRAGGTNWVAHTGQHYDELMNASFWSEMGFEPDFHGVWSRRDSDLNNLKSALSGAKADAVVVYGDTDSTVLGAQAALDLGLPLAHAEAGLRSFNSDMPEERNRVWVDQRAQWLWVPTPHAQDQLRREGLDTGSPWVVNTGDLMLDAFPQRGTQVLRPKQLLVTLHRNTNVDSESRLRNIESAIDGLAKDYDVVWPRHPRHRSAGIRSRVAPDALPMGRQEITDALYSSQWVITDSGGLQKEAFFAGKRAVVLRTETEWTELVAAGWTALISPDGEDLEARIRAQFAGWESDNQEVPPHIYGSGHAAEAMVASLAEGLRSWTR